MSSQCRLWPELFARKFDVPAGSHVEELEIKYKDRSIALRGTTDWRMSHDRLDREAAKVLKVLEDLVVGKELLSQV